MATCGGGTVNPTDVLLAALGTGIRPASQALTASAAALELRSLAAAASGQRDAQMERIAGAPNPSGGDAAQGLRNRLFLKYWGIDYEFYNFSSMHYRGAAP